MSIDNDGHPQVDFVWGNFPLQPNDERGTNVLDPVLDSHEIAYLGWNGFPSYVPNTTSGNAGSGSGGSGSGGSGGGVTFVTLPDLGSYPNVQAATSILNSLGLSVANGGNIDSTDTYYIAHPGAPRYGAPFYAGQQVAVGSTVPVGAVYYLAQDLVVSLSGLYPTISANSYGVTSTDFYGNSAPLVLQVSTSSEWAPAYGQNMWGDRYGANLYFNITVLPGSEVDTKLTAAFNQQEQARQNNPFQYDQYSGVTPAEQLKSWYQLNVPLAPELNLTGLRYADMYGNTKTTFNSGTFSTVEAKFSDNLTWTNPALVPGQFEGTYSTPGQYINRSDMGSTIKYYFNFMLPTTYDTYGVYPTQADAALIGDQDSYGNNVLLSVTECETPFGNYNNLDGDLTITLPA